MKSNIVDEEIIEVIGARSHNLKDISLTIPRNKLVVITGLSGSGKSSLAFDTIYAEGQRRYIESFSSYARQFLGNLERPDVDKISGLSPVISIEQKTVNKNPRSTVGTITEIYDFMRLLFARAGQAYSYVTGEKMVRYSDDQIIDLIISEYKNRKINLLSPIVRARKGHYRELFEDIRKRGFNKVRVDGQIIDITPKMQVDRYKIHDIEIVIDRLEILSDIKSRLNQSLQTAMKHGKGILMVIEHEEETKQKKKTTNTNSVKPRFFSRSLMCPTSGISYDEPAPNLFSFNSPYGACPNCNGLGEVSEIDISKIVTNPKLSIAKGAVAPIGAQKSGGGWIFKQLEAIGAVYNFNLNTPFEDLSEEAVNVLLYGSDELFKVTTEGGTYNTNFEGVATFITRQAEDDPSPGMLRWAQGFTNKKDCPTCHGTRLKKESLYFKIADKNIAELSEMDISVLQLWFKDVEKKLTKTQNTIAVEVLKEIRSRIQFLMEVGLDYVTINRSSKTLSGGEAQRIRLATQIGSQLVGVLYILDEPSIGLHQRDNVRLITALKNLRDVGNSVLVVEHDKDMMMECDYLIDIGPGAGIHGGRVVAAATPKEMLKFDTVTAKYITGKFKIEIPKERRKGNGKKITLKGCTGHNLKNVNVDFPLGKFICVTGVSGSGKSSLINGTLYPLLSAHFYNSEKKPLAYKSITGLDNVDKVIEIDQSPIGRTPRSNPATYTNVFSDIRSLFAELPEAKIRGYKPGRFSFNVKGGRCETCGGAGVKTIEMNFLPDVYVGCDVCNGKRYNRETLEIRYKGKSISDVLNMTIDQACEFFEMVPTIFRQIKTLQDVGLGYITLGQQATTLSGGEAQRVKLATELSKRDTGNTFYILDEPTTGLHFEDIRILLVVLYRLVNNGNTVLVIEHNMDIIKVADHIIDLGPEGGKGGGEILFAGTPEELIKEKRSYTAPFLKKELKG
ncbi:MAG: excinuclease ABC subunit UvrA [Bacteroidota bacterium]|nr:excinuclease ABC subunit UvrA [Bacteroidota bacterium]MDP3145236.1 excinuclease ABC subunit UvrA [Bacteroidota bacterium]